jgi:hypothetical protein
MERSYELEPVDGGWKLTLFEDGEEAGGGKGGEDDYESLLDAGEEFANAGIDRLA